MFSKDFFEIAVDSGATHRHALSPKFQGSIASKSKSSLHLYKNNLSVLVCILGVAQKFRCHLSLLNILTCTRLLSIQKQGKTGTLVYSIENTLQY